MCLSSDCLFPPQPSDVETDSEEYRSQNGTKEDLELEEQDKAAMLKESSDVQVSWPAPCWLQAWSWVHLQILGWKDVLQSFPGLQERCLGSSDYAGFHTAIWLEMTLRLSSTVPVHH